MPHEEITLEGHILDTLKLTQVLDDVTALGGDFQLLEVHIGRGSSDRSHARIEVSAPTEELLRRLLRQLVKHGALIAQEVDAAIVEADMDGVFPDDFYVSTNLPTLVRHGDGWRDVRRQRMDCGVRLDRASGEFECVTMAEVRCGDAIVCGHLGVKTLPPERVRDTGQGDMPASIIAAEKPTTALVRHCARQMIRCRKDGRSIVLVAGPAVVHTGARDLVVDLIERGFVQALLGGNGLAAHDIEQTLYGTSLGVSLEQAAPGHSGHEHHLRATNAVRRVGGLAQAVESGLLTAGVMHACVRNGVEMVLAGSIRDDGPLPEVITDTQVAQQRMRAVLERPDIGLVLMLATGLHAIATANMLSALTPVVAVDVSSTVLAKLLDRGPYRTTGLVTDAAAFLNDLKREIDVLDELAAT